MLVLVVVPVRAQYIGCRMDSGYAETPILRKQFMLQDWDSAMSDGKMFLTVNSIGYHVLRVNGMSVGHRVLQPAVSQLDRHSLSVTYDMGRRFHGGENEIALWLGQGWGRIYNMPAVVHAVLCRQVGDRIDTLLVTDSTWQASPSLYTYTGSWQPLHFGGERFDARWQPSWRPATVVELKGMRVTPQEFEGNRIVGG